MKEREWWCCLHHGRRLFRGNHMVILYSFKRRSFCSSCKGRRQTAAYDGLDSGLGTRGKILGWTGGMDVGDDLFCDHSFVMMMMRTHL